MFFEYWTKIVVYTQSQEDFPTGFPGVFYEFLEDMNLDPFSSKGFDISLNLPIVEATAKIMVVSIKEIPVSIKLSGRDPGFFLA